MRKLIGPVGERGINYRTDVLAVQGMLNQCIGLIVPRAPLKENGCCDFTMIDAIKDFQTRVVKLSSPDGRIDPGGRSLEALTICASGKTYQPKAVANGSGGPGKKYTDNPNEVPTQKTVPAVRDLVALVRKAWPELVENGARTLVAQCMHETGDGQHCYNWNLGNVKAGPSEPHMYLHGVWEVDSPERAKAQVDKAGGLAHIATDEEIKKHRWSCPAGKAVAVFEPPHPQSRFHAYLTLEEGAQRWVAHHQAIAKKHAEFVTELNAGDCAGVAKTLKHVGYYTGGQADYARSMTSKKAEIDNLLGAVK